MKTKILLALCILIAVIYRTTSHHSLKPVKITLFGDETESARGEANDRYQWELMRLADPATGKIPDHIREQELAFASTLPKQSNFSFSPGARMSSNFVNRGPWNVGGRTRSVAVDITNENIVFAGSVNGGLWRSTDAGGSWTRVSPIGLNPAITSIVQDKRPGHTNTWYYATGEGYGTSASADYAFYLGNGLYKSTDGGITWNVLPATASNTPQTFDIFPDIIWRVVLDESDLVNDVVYISCYGVVYKSTDGGNSFSLVRGSVSTPGYFTDISVTSGGIAYVTESSDGGEKGIWRKDPLSAWALISPPGWDTATFNRVVIGINPSNENVVYFLGETPYNGKMTTNYHGDQEWNSLWKYTFLSGNGTGAGGQWTDLSQSIPYDGSQLGNFNSQGGYDLVVAVHPNDSNVVYIGGTNLYRSTDGFTSSLNTTEIGGYDPASTLPFYINYLNHHSDQHCIAFLPSNPAVMFQSNDGGIYKTSDDMATPVVWQPLNNGYITGQFYTVAIDHDTTPNDIVIGGLQDNGTWFTNNTDNSIPWTQPGFGDGAFCAIDNGHHNYYMSRQEGRIARVQCDSSGNPLAFRRIDPIGGNNYLFINPFVLDPNDSDRMYLAAGNKIWRNDSLTSIPLTGQWDSISTGWFLMPDTITISNTVVTALAVSKSTANRLYYGTSKKKVYRVDNANSSTPVVTDITSIFFNVNGNVSCIAVDPNDGNKLMVAFSNYNIYSLFYSTDGGTTFSKVGGNLEANSTGSGAGPSIRWVSIIPTSNGYVYLVGTSTGLYGTNQLNGLSTVWIQLSPNEIGYMVVDMMDFRTTDGYVAVGTHGAGVFSATINDTLLTSIATSDPFALDVDAFPNPSSGELTINFSLLQSGKISMNLYDINGHLVDVIVNDLRGAGDYHLKYTRKNLSAGIYFLKMESKNHSKVKKLVFTE